MSDERYNLLGSNRSPIIIQRKIAIFILIVAIAIFSGSIMITYFGKTCDLAKINTAKIVNKCESLVCDYNSIYQAYYSCPGVSSTTVESTTTTKEPS
jgi:hypothetical protein